MRRLFRRLLRILFIGSLLGGIVLVWLIHAPARHIPRIPAVDDWVYLEQGWGPGADATTRQRFYYTPVGAPLHGLRYDWLVQLEMPWGRKRFADPAHLRSYGFVVDPQPTAANLARLPVGFARRFDPGIGEAILDMSCAACHTGQLIVERNGRRTAIRVDGGPAAHAFKASRLGGFVPTLTASLASTYLNPLKFRRFGKKVLGEERYARGKWRLHQDLGQVLSAFVGQAWREDRSGLYPLAEGFGRTAGQARLANTLFGDGLGGANHVIGDAPIRYSPLWDVWKLERTGSGASASQPMARSLLEAIRAGARVPLLDRHGRPLPEDERYRSSIAVGNLFRIEKALQRLEPPRWPEEVLGRIDRAKAERGRVLFEQHCRRCHGPFAPPPALVTLVSPLRTPADPLWQTVSVPVAEIGTDPKAALAAASGTVDLGSSGLTADDVRAAFQPTLEEYRRRLAVLETQLAELRKTNDLSAEAIEGGWRDHGEGLAAFTRSLAALDPRRVPLATAEQLIVLLARRHHDDEHGLTAAQRACLDGFGALELPRAAPAYRARPLAGVWATGPFLHNGSVPTLYQLLSPQRDRAARFFVSPGAFDPVPVGQDAKAKGDGYWLDTRDEGSSNVGHEFRFGYEAARPGGEPQYGVIGPALSEDERWALVEYLKVHEDPITPPGRVLPDCGIR